jgi:DEAD/DEAH box helicase domain-containing protein
MPERPATGPLRTMQLLRERSVEAVLGRSGLNHPALVAEIRRRFGSTDVGLGALVQEPVIEGAAPFLVEGRTFADCSGSLLHPDVIRAISSEKAGDYRFPPDAQPYRHQIEAWEHLTAPERNSVLVSSGTGSGKTECFLMPLLHDLATEASAAGRLSGVRALALYPLNALIASQEERLRAWTAPFGDKVRFGLYNGLTPERLRAQYQPGPEQVGDRETLRKDPPPILVTNVTMLEYMLVRRIDRPLVDNSRGKLRWIILDEAHSYVGSAAAEIALLLRRVLLTFGVKAQDVRFVATSATIGGEGVDVTDDLRHFLRDISGASEHKVKVVLGQREDVLLPVAASSSLLSSTDLINRDRVAASPAVQAFVREAERGPVPLAQAAKLLVAVGHPLEDVIEAIADDRDKQRGPLLPLRIHGFLRAVPGLWSCINPGCSDAPKDWAYGAISSERIDNCTCCNAPVLEIMSCGECGEPYLDCEERGGRIQARFTPPVQDEFAALRERELADEDADDPSEDEDGDGPYDAQRLAIALRPLRGCREAHVEPLTGTRHDQASDDTRPFPVHSVDSCGACDAAVSKRVNAILRPFRYGAPYLIGNAAPVMLEGVEPRKLDAPGAYRPPADGRQLLSFTDSRQGSARFAANLQTTSERAFVRGFVYHAVQGSMVAAGDDDPEVVKMRSEIATLQGVGSDALAELIASKQTELAAMTKPNISGLAWTELRKGLAAQPEVHAWMAKVWGPREDRYRQEPLAFAEFLLMREFNRRPRRGNTAETMGLARLRFDAVETAKTVPPALRAKGKTLADWQGLLYAIIDMTVRGRTAIRLDWSDQHWLHARQPISTLLPPGEKSEARLELAWPHASKSGPLSNLVAILEKSLGLDHNSDEDRRDLNEVLETAWSALQPALYSLERPGYALDFSKARIAPVVDGWRCPVTGNVLAAIALGLTLYGHREGVRPADLPPQPLVFPKLPISFPKGAQVSALRTWLTTDPKIQALRDQGVWINQHDRIALLSPYTRAAEHSAQQPAERLRRFEREFKRGEINILNCSTTMEMGVDIGSVSAVMMTNVPPSLANYRQRVGRAGRRRQGFASSLTYTRDTPLDRETFRDPAAYLRRQTRAPKVRLDSRRIVQRHVNALLLARWFAAAGGEAQKTRAGEFFGCPELGGAERPANSPGRICIAWMASPTAWQDLHGDVEQLVAGTALAGDRTLFAEAARALELAETAIASDWEALQAQIANAGKEEGRASLEYQLKRLARENLLKELVVRGFLPGHGLPTAVVPFVHEDKPGADEPKTEGETGDEGNRRRRSYPSRTLDIAIRDYAPGSEVVVNGLVYRSAGVTLNWQRPADDSQAREVQALRVFWTCPHCGAADCAAVAPDRCPSCRDELPFEARRRFLEPAGFVVDMGEKPHADTDDVGYIAPEAEQIVARNAPWQALVAPELGRMRTSADGLVFYSSRGPGHKGYHICLDCGRAESASEMAAGQKPLADHKPLRGTRRNADGLCPGNEKSFKVTAPVALGYEASTDVAEFQPQGLENAGAAWAVVAALREALARRIGIETGEIGIAVRPAKTPLGQRTHSLYLYDRAAGGAGFAPQAARLFEDILAAAAHILDCKAPGCRRGCSACVLTADLFDQQDVIDRKAALAWASTALAALGTVAEEDRAAPEARYCASLADALVQAAEGGNRAITILAGPETDVAGIADGLFAFTMRQIASRGGRISLALEPDWLDRQDAAARLALRDAAKTLGLDLRKGAAPMHPNGARTLAQTGGDNAAAWVSREPAAACPGLEWGGAAVQIRAAPVPLMSAIGLDTLLPASGTRYLELSDELDGDLIGFGQRFARLLLPHVRGAGGEGALAAITYNDRYLQTPLTVRLLTEAAKGLRDALGNGESLPIRITTNPLRENERQPFAPDHDWQYGEDRDDVLIGLLEEAGFAVTLDSREAAHGRTMTLHFASGKAVRVVFDQGFGPWRAPRIARFDFGVAAPQQLTKLMQFNALITAKGAGYMVVTAG